MGKYSACPGNIRVISELRFQCIRVAFYLVRETRDLRKPRKYRGRAGRVCICAQYSLQRIDESRDLRKTGKNAARTRCIGFFTDTIKRFNLLA
jgi:hypothetical protein